MGWVKVGDGRVMGVVIIVPWIMVQNGGLSKLVAFAVAEDEALGTMLALPWSWKVQQTTDDCTVMGYHPIDVKLRQRSQQKLSVK